MRAMVPLLALVLALGGCAVQENVASCQLAPPLKRETIPKPPVSETPLIWQPGHWDWNGAAYTYREGLWVPRTGQSNQWMDGYWNRVTVPGPCIWNPAHWL